MKKKVVKNNYKSFKLYEAIFFGLCILLFVFIIFRIWW